MKLGELNTLMVRIEDLLKNTADPITEGAVLDPVALAIEDKGRIYDRTTIERMIKLNQADAFRVLKDGAGNPRPLKKGDIKTVFSTQILSTAAPDGCGAKTP